MSSKQRHFRRQRWIALWAVLALLLNQTAVASHLCLDSGLAEPGAAVQIQSGHSHSEGAAGKAGSSASMLCPHSGSHDTGACMVHCADDAESAQQAKAPEIPMLPGAHPWRSDALLETAIVPCARTIDLVRDSGKRRLYEFCALLI